MGKSGNQVSWLGAILYTSFNGIVFTSLSLLWKKSIMRAACAMGWYQKVFGIRAWMIYDHVMRIIYVDTPIAIVLTACHEEVMMEIGTPTCLFQKLKKRKWSFPGDKLLAQVSVGGCFDIWHQCVTTSCSCLANPMQTRQTAHGLNIPVRILRGGY